MQGTADWTVFAFQHMSRGWHVRIPHRHTTFVYDGSYPSTTPNSLRPPSATSQSPWNGGHCHVHVCTDVEGLTTNCSGEKRAGSARSLPAAAVPTATGRARSAEPLPMTACRAIPITAIPVQLIGSTICPLRSSVARGPRRAGGGGGGRLPTAANQRLKVGRPAARHTPTKTGPRPFNEPPDEPGPRVKATKTEETAALQSPFNGTARPRSLPVAGPTTDNVAPHTPTAHSAPRGLPHLRVHRRAPSAPCPPHQPSYTSLWLCVLVRVPLASTAFMTLAPHPVSRRSAQQPSRHPSRRPTSGHLDSGREVGRGARALPHRGPRCRGPRRPAPAAAPPPPQLRRASGRDSLQTVALLRDEALVGVDRPHGLDEVAVREGPRDHVGPGVALRRAPHEPRLHGVEVPLLLVVLGQPPRGRGAQGGLRGAAAVHAPAHGLADAAHPRLFAQLLQVAAAEQGRGLGEGLVLGGGQARVPVLQDDFEDVQALLRIGGGGGAGLLLSGGGGGGEGVLDPKLGVPKMA